MGSVNSTNPGLTNLLQTLTNENSPLAATLSQPNVEKALATAPASDIVQISDEALQLQTTDALFGVSGGSSSSSPTDALFGITDASATNTATTTDPLLAALLPQQSSTTTNTQTVDPTVNLFG